MPCVYWDEQKGRAQFQRRFPSDVQPLTGAWFRHKYLKSVSLSGAMQLSVEQHLEFNAIVEAARERLADPAGMVEVLRDSRGRLRLMRERMRALKAQLAGMDEGLQRVDDEAAFYRLGARLGMSMKIAEARGVVSTESVLNLWTAEIVVEKKEPPPPGSVSRKRRIMERMFAHLKAPDDLAGLSLPQLQRYKEHLMSLGGRIAYDHLGDITHLYRVADRNNKFEAIGGNPCAKITVPGKPEHKKRPPFTDDEARLILVDARTAEPVARWSHWLSAFTGTIESEIVGAGPEDFYQVGDQWVFDMTSRKLKSGYRPRIVPLHHSVISEGFIDYMETRKGKPLFDVDAAKACDLLNAHIRGLHIRSRDKVFYCWRHGFITQLEDLTTPDRSRYLAGHAPRDIHAKHYLHHELPKLVDAINGLRDPTR